MSEFPPNFSLAELTRSERATREGIPNDPTALHKANLAALAWRILQPLRDGLGVPIKVTSGYRSPLLNSKTPGSSATSQHSAGEAADLVSADNKAMFDYIREHLPFDQLIFEFGSDKQPDWVHVSYRAVKQRGIVLRAVKKGGKTIYQPYK
jgi:hypothetical protein